MPIMPVTPRKAALETMYQIIGFEAETTMNERQPESIPRRIESDKKAAMQKIRAKDRCHAAKAPL
jgi:hypothetical protein